MAKDTIHDAIKNALINDGWHITDDPFRIDYKGFALKADLAAEYPFVAEKHGQKIVVEVKSFGGRSLVRQLQQAIGQYEMYFDFMTLTNLEHELYLGISELTYNDFFMQEAVQVLRQRRQIKLLVVDIDEEKIVKWIR